jgi:GT2 family glycosyltransferase
VSDGLARLTAVIPTWETADLTIRCARALIEDGMPAERVVAVDNGSRDDTRERLAAELPGCRVVRIEENAGYGGAANAGAEAVPGDAYLVLNNDAFVHRPGSVARMLAALGDERVGVVVPRLLNVDLTLQRNVVPLHSPAVALVRSSGLSRLVPDRWQPRWSTHWRHDHSREIGAANGPVLLVRGATWDELGGFERRIHMYAEDLDLCWRAHLAGWKAWFERDAEFVHIGNATGRRHWDVPARAEMVWRQEAAMIRRHMPPRQAQATLTLTAAGLAARRVAFAALGRRDAAASVGGALRGLRAGSRD